MSQGGEANNSGQFLERIIAEEFKTRGVPIFDYSPEKEHVSDWVSECFLVRNVPYTSIYGANSRSEFVYRDSRLVSDIRIECKWQQAHGSCDEKFPYLIWNAIDAMPEKEIWLVVDGDGWRTGAVDWLKREAAKVAAKTIRVLNLSAARQRIRSLRT